jgi:hypothetical protein
VQRLLATYAAKKVSRKNRLLDVMAIKTNYCDATMAMLSRSIEKIVVSF